MLDIKELDQVEVFIDDTGKMWVNSEEGCILRVGKINGLTIDDKYTSTDRIKSKIKDIRYQIRCNDYNTKMMSPERSPLSLHSGHSCEMMNMHIEDGLRELEQLLGIEVNDDYSLIRSDRRSDFKPRDYKESAGD